METDCSNAFNLSRRASYGAPYLSSYFFEGSLGAGVFSGSLCTGCPAAHPRRKPTHKMETTIVPVFIPVPRMSSNETNVNE
jgi:hypothetical protein